MSNRKKYSKSHVVKIRDCQNGNVFSIVSKNIVLYNNTLCFYLLHDLCGSILLVNNAIYQCFKSTYISERGKCKCHGLKVK